MRAITTFTIDPETAKDFDDALSLELLKNGNYEIGVHIADVTHYVKEGSELDKEAAKRTTSVYLVDRVLPMLPEKLSNGVCSLRPNEDKLTFSAIFEFNQEGKILNEWYGKTVIHSNRRFTYEEAQEVLDGNEGDFAEEIRLLNRYAHILRKARFKKGAINFESPEIRFKLDENGKPLEAYVKERKDAHMLIEDFMLLANKMVAKKIMDNISAFGNIFSRNHSSQNKTNMVNQARYFNAVDGQLT
jgi:ribonuclease R